MTDSASTVITEPNCPQCGAPVPLPGYVDMVVCDFCGSTLAKDQVPVIEEQPLHAVQQQRLRSVQCSQCAGPLSAREGKRVLTCERCGVRVAVTGHGGLTHWYFPARVDRTTAVAAGTGWLSEFPGVAQGVRQARLTEAKLAYVPIWEHRALTAGWEFGALHRSRMIVPHRPLTDWDQSEPLQLQVLHESVQEPRLQERRHYLPATDFEALGATRPRVTGRELLVPLLAGEIDPTAIVLEAKGDAAEVVEKGRAAAQMPLTANLNPELHIFLFREAASLLYYPLWLLLFRQGDQFSKVVVDGRDGTVNSATAPADQRRHMAAMVAKVSALVIAGAVLVYLAVTVQAVRIPALVAAAIAAVAAGMLGIRFRPEKEVEYHDSFSG